MVARLRKCRYFAAAVDPCGGTFRAQGRKSTCSAKCKLRDEQDRLAARDFSPKKPRICALCKVRPVYYRSAMTCLECRDEYADMMRNAQAVNRYWADPEAARAKSNAKAKAARAKDPVKWRAKKNAAYHADFAKDPEKYRAKGRTQYAKDLKKSRANGRATYAKHADEINAQKRAEYASDVELARAKQKTKTKSRQERHPRRFRALRKAVDQRRRDRISRERGW